MTLRVTLDIVPFGDESGTYEIFHMDINNTGLVENLGFGHEICSYEYFVMKPVPYVLQGEDGPFYEVYSRGKIPRHDRRDGPWHLVNLCLEDMKVKNQL